MVYKTKPYPLSLRKKIIHKAPRKPTILTGSEDEEVMKKYHKDFEKYKSVVAFEKSLKIIILFDHYEIDFVNSDNPHLELCISMAERHVPGFKVQDEIKRKPEKWNAIRLAVLYWDVESYAMTHPKKSKNSICAILQKKEPWNVEKSPRTLYNKYMHSLDSSVIEVYEKMLRDSEKPDEVREIFGEFIDKMRKEQIKKLHGY